MQYGGKWLSVGMMDFNSTMVAPVDTQLPLRMMDARMWPVTVPGEGKLTLLLAE